jgi:hypothetical protein
MLACVGDAATLVAHDGAAMEGKIALEEHFAIAETVMESKPFVPADHWPELEYRLTDVQDSHCAVRSTADWPHQRG